MTVAWRKYGRTAAMEAGGHLRDGPYFIADYLVRFLRVAALLAIWRVVFEGRGAVAGLDGASMLTYALISEVFAEQLTARTYIEFMIWEGRLSPLLLRPLGVTASLIAESAGRWLVGFVLFSLPLLLLAPAMGVNPLPAGSANAAWFAVSLGLAIGVGLAVDFLFCIAVVAMDVSVWVMDSFRSAVTVAMTGALIPLALLPWGIGALFQWLPFASMSSAPLRIYTGTGSPALLVPLQAAWLMALWPAGILLWRKYRERLAGYGG